MEGKQGAKISLSTFLLILAILLIAIMAFFMYKIYTDKETANNKIIELKNTLQATIDTINNQNDMNNISVIDAVNYYEKYYNNLFKIQLPKIVGSSAEIEKINNKILNETLPLTYRSPIIHGLTEGKQMSKGSLVNYKYLIENNILIIYIYENIPEDGSAIAASGDGLLDNTYYYDIKDDKSLTISEVAERLKLDISEIYNPSNEKINTYKELETCHANIYIDDNSELKIRNIY